MSRLFLVLIYLFFLGGCSLVHNSERPNTKKHLLQGIDSQISHSLESEPSYEQSSYTEDMVEDLAGYVSSNNNIQEITNLSSPIKQKSTFNSNLMVVKKHFDKKKVKLSVEEMPLNKFLHLIFSKVLKVDYILDKNVQNNKEPVSINLKEEISKQKLFSIVSNILDEFNIIIDVEKNIFYIKSSTRRAVESVHRIYLGDSVPSGIDDNEIIYMMRPYFYNNSLNKHTIFVKEYFLSKKGSIVIDSFENIIKIQDKVKNIKKALEFYSFIDQPTMRNKNMKLVRMKHMEVNKFIEQLQPIIKNYGILISKNLRSSGLQFIPIKQINSFLVLSDKEEWIKTVLFWKSKLDILEKKTSIDNEFFVYKPKNRKAEELVEVIQNFSEAYGVDSNKSKKHSTLEDKNNDKNTFKVVLDKERNNIIIYTSKQQYNNIEKMLQRLDTLPKQVLVEVTIAEITLRDSLQFGLEWFLKNTGTKYGYTLNALGSGSSGVLGTISSISGSFGATFNALAEKKYVNVLSNPKLLVLNNHSANINIGNQIPIITSQASASDLREGTTPSILQNIQYRSTGITLDVTPTINSEGYLSLNIKQTVSNAQKNTTSDISSPIIFNRSLATDVILKSGETVLLGGLITEDKSRDETKIPFLGDLPIIGKLFSTAGDSIDKTELVILVKPTIISNNSDATIVTEALLDLMNFK
jgi:general secretion pathway protein D